MSESDSGQRETIAVDSRRTASSESDSAHSETISVDVLSRFLLASGYQAKVRPNSIIVSATHGANFFICVRHDGWLQFAMRLPNQFGIDLSGINEFNKNYRMGKLFLDGDGDIGFTSDMRVFPDGLESMFDECLVLWNQLVGLLIRFLQDRRQEKTTSPYG